MLSWIDLVVVPDFSNINGIFQDCVQCPTEKWLATAMGGEFRRVQFTSDLLPADILGVNVFDPGERAFRFRPGPVFCQLLLADEINRTTPRTQSALLQAMEEQHVTLDGVPEAHRVREFVRVHDEPLANPQEILFALICQ